MSALVEVLLVAERHRTPASAEGTALRSWSSAAKALGIAASRNPGALHGSFECSGLASGAESKAMLGPPDANLESFPTAPL